MQAIAANGHIVNDEAQDHVQEPSSDLDALAGRHRRRPEPHFRNDLPAMRAVRLIQCDLFAAISTLPRAFDALLKAAQGPDLVFFAENLLFLSHSIGLNRVFVNETGVAVSESATPPVPIPVQIVRIPV
jgi:hypothetical protein